MKKYQAIAFLLSTAMIMGNISSVWGASSDVLGHWAEATITKWQNEGRVGGYEDGTFRPDRTITRAEFVRLLNNAVPTAFTSTVAINFSDVKQSDWYYADVAKAVRGKVTNGFEDGTFRPNETVTRMQAAVFLCNAKGLTPNEAGADIFTDAASIPSWAKGAVGAAVSAGYLSGYPNGSFDGNKSMTRAEAVSTLDRVLGGGSANILQNETSMTDKQNESEKEQGRTAEAGNMVWTSGGSGGGSSKKSSSSSNSSNEIKTSNVTIRSQEDADEYEGKTLTGTTTIYADNGLELNDIRFKGDVDIHVKSDAAVASAYADSDVAVAAAYFAKINIYFEGKTSISGTITIVENNVPSSQVVITTRNPRALGASIIAKAATAIFGFEFNKVEAQAPVEVAEGAKIHTVEVSDDGSLDVLETAEGVDKVDVIGDAKDIVLNGESKTDITIQNGASVENIEVKQNAEANIALEGSAVVSNVAVSDNANVEVAVNDNAKVENITVNDNANADMVVKDEANIEKVELSDTATAKIEVAPEAKVDEISSTSTGKTEISGEGEVGKIEASNPSTIEKSEEVQTPVDVIDTPSPSPNPDDNTPGEDDNKPDEGDTTTGKITANPPEVSISSGENYTELTTELEGDIIWSAVDGNGKEYAVRPDEQDSKKAKLIIPAYTQKGTIITVTAKSGEEIATIEIKIITHERSPIVEVVKVNAPATGKIVKGGSSTFTFELEGENLNFIDQKAVNYEVIADGKVIDCQDGGEANDETGVNYREILENYIATGLKITLAKDAPIEDGKEIVVKAISKVDNTKFGEASVIVVAGLEEEEKETLAIAVEALENAETITVEGLPAKDRQNKEAITEKIVEAAKQIEGIKDVEGIDVEATVTNLPEDGLTVEDQTDVEVTFKVTMLGVPAEDESGNEKQIEKTVSVNVLALEEVTSVTVGGFLKPIAGQEIPNLPNILSVGEYEKYNVFMNENELESTHWNVLNEESGEFELLPPDSKFESGKTYQADIWLKTQVGYEFVGEEIKTDISGQTQDAEVSKASVIGTGEGNKVNVLVTFPSIEAAFITQEDVSVDPVEYPGALILYPKEGYSNCAVIIINNAADIVATEERNITIEAVGENAAVAAELKAESEIIEEEGTKKIKVTFTNTTGTATKDKKVQYKVTIPKEMVQPKQGYMQPEEDLSVDIGVVVEDPKIVPSIQVSVPNNQPAFKWVQGKEIKPPRQEYLDHVEVKLYCNNTYNFVEEQLKEGADISEWFEGLPKGVNAVVQKLENYDPSSNTLYIEFTGVPETSTWTTDIVLKKMVIPNGYIENYNENTDVDLTSGMNKTITIIVTPVVDAVGIIEEIPLPKIGDTELPKVELAPDNEKYYGEIGGLIYGYRFENNGVLTTTWKKESGTGDTVQAGDVYSLTIPFLQGYIDDGTRDCNHYYSFDYESINTFKGAPEGEGITIEKVEADETEIQFKITYTVPENEDANTISSVGITKTITPPTTETAEEIGILTAKEGDTDKYTVSATEWTKSNESYTTDITFTANKGYTFAENVSKLVIEGIDESAISVGEIGTDANGNQTLKFTITIPSTANTNLSTRMSTKRSIKRDTIVDNNVDEKTEEETPSNNADEKTEEKTPSDNIDEKTEEETEEETSSDNIDEKTEEKTLSDNADEKAEEVLSDNADNKTEKDDTSNNNDEPEIG